MGHLVSHLVRKLSKKTARKRNRHLHLHHPLQQPVKHLTKHNLRKHRKPGVDVTVTTSATASPTLPLPSLHLSNNPNVILPNNQIPSRGQSSDALHKLGSFTSYAMSKLALVTIFKKRMSDRKLSTFNFNHNNHKRKEAETQPEVKESEGNEVPNNEEAELEPTPGVGGGTSFRLETGTSPIHTSSCELDLNNNRLLKQDIVKSLLSSRSAQTVQTPDELYRQNLERFEALLAFTATSTSEEEDDDVDIDVQDENHDHDDEEAMEQLDLRNMNVKWEVDENNNPVLILRQPTPTPTPSTPKTPKSPKSLKSPKSPKTPLTRIIASSKNRVEVDAYFAKWVKDKMCESTSCSSSSSDKKKGAQARGKKASTSSGSGSYSGGYSSKRSNNNNISAAKRLCCGGKLCLGASAPPAYLDYGGAQTYPGAAGRKSRDPMIDRLKNVDVVEHLCYMVPQEDANEGCEEDDEDDCDYFAVCESCGEMEPVAPELAAKLKGQNKRKKKKPESTPVTYTRRQRFNLKQGGEDDGDGPPFKYEPAHSCRCPCCNAGLRRRPDCGCKCCQTLGRGRRVNSFDEIPVGKNPQIRRILCPVEAAEKRYEDAGKMLPELSGVYKFDCCDTQFERQVPRTPTPIVVEVEEPRGLDREELMNVAKGLAQKKQQQQQCPCCPCVTAATPAPCEEPCKELDPIYLPPIYGQYNSVGAPCCLDQNNNQCCGAPQQQQKLTGGAGNGSQVLSDNHSQANSYSNSGSFEEGSEEGSGSGSGSGSFQS